MYEPSASWRPIDASITTDISVSRPFHLSRLVLVRSGTRETLARWRHPLERYDSSKDSVIRRQGAWWCEQDRILDFEPTEYRDR
jgi:hypothetical protein